MPELGYATKQCECTGCGEMFNSVYGFDKHRVLVSKAERDEDSETRRCLTPDEMVKLGWAKNARGFWVTSLWQR